MTNPHLPSTSPSSTQQQSTEMQPTTPTPTPSSPPPAYSPPAYSPQTVPDYDAATLITASDLEVIVKSYHPPPKGSRPSVDGEWIPLPPDFKVPESVADVLRKQRRPSRDISRTLYVELEPWSADVEKAEAKLGYKIKGKKEAQKRRMRTLRYWAVVIAGMTVMGLVVGWVVVNRKKE
ncbi:hypothetical protein BJ508DRAFT_418317 [Ascobolus immersus RN42]|uniref:Uncharacterized protein n=1 Tax=Ascobolus immersus RN42 TaxID=1160509 RepID=A0A3N4HP78_ASCIM|nr:hypothetical protein BJ508DRAFT_418317 [Ascobolus immersus RN42]